MNPRHRFARLCLWLACALPLPALAAAGLVQFVAGEVQMRRSDLLSAVARGALLESGDTVLTGATGRAQIRFTDGGLVALYPDSQFTVTRYVDAGDAAQDSFAVGLLRGSMRAITGLIGKRNPANYQLTTPTAVVGIRGSAFRAFFNAQGLLEVGGEADEIEVCTQAGCVGLRVGESVLVLSPERLPVYIMAPASSCTATAARRPWWSRRCPPSRGRRGVVAPPPGAETPAARRQGALRLAVPPRVEACRRLRFVPRRPRPPHRRPRRPPPRGHRFAPRSCVAVRPPAHSW